MNLLNNHPLSPILRVGVVAYEKGPSILTTEDPDGARGLPGTRITAEHMTRSECEAALSQFIKLRYNTAKLARITEFNGQWDGQEAHIIVYALSQVWTINDRTYQHAYFIDLSRSELPKLGPSVAHLMAARAHAIQARNVLQPACAA